MNLRSEGFKATKKHHLFGNVLADLAWHIDANLLLDLLVGVHTVGLGNRGALRNVGGVWSFDRNLDAVGNIDVSALGGIAVAIGGTFVVSVSLADLKIQSWLCIT